MVGTPGKRGLPAPQNGNYVARAPRQYLKT
jgi:hypothetical protein